MKEAAKAKHFKVGAVIWHAAFSFCWSLLIFLQFDRLVESGAWAVSGSHPRWDFVSVVAGWNTGPLRPEEVRADSESCFGCSSVQRQCCKLFGRLLDPPVWGCADSWSGKALGRPGGDTGYTGEESNSRGIRGAQRGAQLETSKVPNSRHERRPTRGMRDAQLQASTMPNWRQDRCPTRGAEVEVEASKVPNWRGKQLQRHQRCPTQG